MLHQVNFENIVCGKINTERSLQKDNYRSEKIGCGNIVAERKLHKYFYCGKVVEEGFFFNVLKSRKIFLKSQDEDM